MGKLRIGVVGLGGIAQRAWLPVLGASADWTLQGAWSPSREKAQRICETWQMPYVDSVQKFSGNLRCRFRSFQYRHSLRRSE